MGYRLSSGAMLSCSSALPHTQPSSVSWSSSRTLVSMVCLQLLTVLHSTLSFIDIERTYGQRKPLAQRSPLLPKASRKLEGAPETHTRTSSVSSVASTDAPTPAVTEGETATESEEVYTETETEQENERSPSRRAKRHSGLGLSNVSSREESPKGASKRIQVISQHDLFHRYFRKDTVFLHNVDLLRYVPKSWIE